MTIALEQPSQWQEKRLRFMGLDYEALTEDEALDLLISRSPDAPFASLVTPNADHLVRIDRFPEIAHAYYEAEFCFNDSRVVTFLARLRGVELPTITGADLVASLISSPDFDLSWPLLLIGGSPEIAAALRQQFGMANLIHYDAPMGLRHDPDKMRKVVEFIEEHPARFTFLAVGSPQQELIAREVAQRHKTIGVGLCIGAAMEFLVYPQRRAPRWMSQTGLEWLFRLSREPGRLWRRYLLDSPQMFRLAARDWAASLRVRK
jgi:N-acetylglucosaminyldiphosphoundecaprenol N-acetyl-beta-D-mannosaminyltransferase